MSRSPHQSQRALPPMGLPSSESRSSAFRKSESESDRDRIDEEYRIAATLLNAALEHPRYGMSRDEVAHFLSRNGVTVTRNLVDKWCNPAERSCPSQVQLMRLPINFQLAYRTALDDHYGHRREAVKRALIDSVGDALLALEA